MKDERRLNIDEGGSWYLYSIPVTPTHEELELDEGVRE